MAQPTITIPPDNQDLVTHVIEEDIPHLSPANMEAVGAAMNRRYAEMKAAQQREALETHYAYLCRLPAGTPLQIDMRGHESFAYGESVTIERPLRLPSMKIRVHDRHGKPWHVPMEWLISVAEDESMRTAMRDARDARGRAVLLRSLGV